IYSEWITSIELITIRTGVLTGTCSASSGVPRPGYVNSHFHFWPVARISMADLGGVRKSTKPLKPPTNSGTTSSSGMIDQVSSSIVLCSLVFCAISFAARDFARYFVQKRNIAQKIATVKNSDIQSMKSQSASVFPVVTDALGGIQKYGESGNFGSVGSEPNIAEALDATEARVEMLAIIALR